MLLLIKDNVIKKGFQGVYDDLRKKVGGVFGVFFVFELLCGKQQIYSVKFRIICINIEDDVEELLKYVCDKGDLFLYYVDFFED